MGMLRVCLEFERMTSDYNDLSDYNSSYKNIYKPLVSFLYSNPDFFFSFYFSGPQLEWFKSQNPEFLDLIRKLLDRKQIEILGGGFYNPIFPLLFPQDRTGQIEMLSSELRKYIGKRPRGMSLAADAWESSLLTSFHLCGMEYIILDSSLIAEDKNVFIPLIMADRGKTLNILPSSSKFSSSFAADETENFIKKIIKAVDEKNKINNLDRVITIKILEKDIKNILLQGKLEKFLSIVKEKYSEKITLSLPLTAVRNSSTFVKAFIPSGISAAVEKWSYIPYTIVESKTQYPTNIYDFLQTYKSNHALYNRMIYVSLLVNQCHGDKMRKKTAREKLWEAQKGDAYIGSTLDPFVSVLERKNAYKALAEAEKLVRECSGFTESITRFDYNSDGFNEYICRLEQYNACIGLDGGSVFELDILKNAGNYADNNSRILPFDSCNDNYFRGFFVDHLLESDNFDKYIKGEPCKNGIFSEKQYKEVAFVKQRNEIHLESQASFGSYKQNVLLKKKYTITSNGLTVQYILKNNSSNQLKAKFAVESNFAQTTFKNLPLLNVVSNGEVKEFSTDKSCAKLYSSGQLKNVSAVQFMDIENNTSFLFEPNENSSLTFSPMTFLRPKDSSQNLETIGKLLSLALIWDVELEGGMEMEKTINFTITYSKKKSKVK